MRSFFMKVAFLTLGCKVNFYETEKMSEQFRQKGFDVVDFQEKADIYVVNTCTVTNIADRKSRQMLHRAKKKNPDSFVVAVGCYVESGGEELLADKAVDAAFSNKEKESVAERIIERFYEERPNTESCTTAIDKNDVKERISKRLTNEELKRFRFSKQNFDNYLLLKIHHCYLM